MKYLKWLICFLVISVFLSSLISAGEGDWDETCMRAIPQPLFDSKMKMVKTEKFRQATKEEDAEEEVVFSSGDRLIIRNWGCEYFVNTFRYESKAMLVSSESLKGSRTRLERSLVISLLFWFSLYSSPSK